MSIANTQAETIINAGIIDDNDQVLARVEHLRELETLVGNVYPNKYERSKISGAEDTVSNLVNYAPIIEIVGEIKRHVATLAEREKPDQELKESLNVKLKEFGDVRISGRLTTTPRTMGKAAFVHLSDGVNRLQIYVRRDDIKGLANDGEQSEVNGWDLFKLLDGGDFVGVAGFLFLTNTGELSVHVETIQFLSKALLPLPDKMHGIADPELQRRYRYADLIASSLQIEHEGLTTREVFERRAKLISGMRRFLDDHDYIEVETPMLTPKATGAAATPFETHHNALDIPLYARIAPELYLKRLTVGGFEKVYELNRNFRNEGLSHKHNPEFTMLEFYCAYMDVNGMMDFAEAMLKESVQKATGGSLIVKYGMLEIDFSKFTKLTMRDAVNNSSKLLLEELERFADRNPPPSMNYPAMLIGNSDFPFVNNWLDDEKLTTIFIQLDDVLRRAFVRETSTDGTAKIWKVEDGLAIDWRQKAELLFEGNDSELSQSERFEMYFEVAKERLQKIAGTVNTTNSEENNARNIVRIFEITVEPVTQNPTFIIDYPKSISPLSKASPENPQIAERFELFICGMECANGFSELNDPQEQYERFVDQTKERESGDAEAMVLDEDYIRALAYGMPPAAGIGIGIDRLVMLLTNKHSIRDVILFPHLRPEKHEPKTE